MTVHLLLPLDVPVLTDKATRAASVKASLTPRLRFAEHSIIIFSMLPRELVAQGAKDST